MEHVDALSRAAVVMLVRFTNKDLKIDTDKGEKLKNRTEENNIVFLKRKGKKLAYVPEEGREKLMLLHHEMMSQPGMEKSFK